MFRWFTCPLAVVLLVVVDVGLTPNSAWADANSDADMLLKQSGISAGFFVHLGTATVS